MSKVIEIRQKGDFKKSLTFFSHIKSWSVRPILEKYGKLGEKGCCSNAAAENRPKQLFTKNTGLC